MSNRNSLNLAANGVPQKLALGQYVYALIRTATAAAEVSFDGQNWQPANQNDQAGPFDPPQQNIYFRASAGVAAVVSFSTSLVPFAAQSTNQKVETTYAKGSVKAALTTVAGGAVAIPSGDNGHRRKTIIFSLDLNGAGANQFAIITDANGNRFCTVYQTSAIAFETDAAFKAYASYAGMDLYVGEIYYNS